MKSRAICILGMHRSGTSVISRIINLLGFYLGEDSNLMKGNADNPEGFWERHDIVDFHEKIMAQLKMKWDTPISLPVNWTCLEEMKPFKHELTKLILQNFSNQKAWAWKDPRTSLLLTLWKEVLNDLGIRFSCLVSIRNPLDVAKSLEKRNGYSHDKSFGIWFNYNINILYQISSIPHIILSYDRLLNDWRTEIERCMSLLKIDASLFDKKLSGMISDFINLNFRHSFSSMNELLECGAPFPVIELYELLIEAYEKVSIPDSMSFRNRLERLFKIHQNYGRYFKDDLFQLWELDQILSKISGKLEEKERRIESLLNSYSWKITAPLRSLYNILMRE